MTTLMQWPVLFLIAFALVIGTAVIVRAFDERTRRRHKPSVQIERRHAANDNWPRRQVRGGPRWL